MAFPPGFEPGFTVPKTAVLPLYYGKLARRVVDRRLLGIEHQAGVGARTLTIEPP